LDNDNKSNPSVSSQHEKLAAPVPLSRQNGRLTSIVTRAWPKSNTRSRFSQQSTSLVHSGTSPFPGAQGGEGGAIRKLPTTPSAKSKSEGIEPDMKTEARTTSLLVGDFAEGNRHQHLDDNVNVTTAVILNERTMSMLSSFHTRQYRPWHLQYHRLRSLKEGLEVEDSFLNPKAVACYLLILAKRQHRPYSQPKKGENLKVERPRQ
jgi:hypothetical protein